MQCNFFFAVRQPSFEKSDKRVLERFNRDMSRGKFIKRVELVPDVRES